MIIYIPTRGRRNRQTTWDNLPSSLREITRVVCPPEEEFYHRAEGRNPLVCPVEGIIRKRQFILDTTEADRICMLDDDLMFFRRKDPGAWNLTRCSGSDVERLFEQAEMLLDDYPQVGVSPRQGNNRFFPETLVTCSRVTNFHCYDMKVIRELGIRFHDPLFPETFTMEDFHVTLSLLESGYPNAIITDFAWDQHGSNTQGGCSVYRNAETQAQSAHLLAQRHLGFVRVTQKETKGAWAGVASSNGGGTRTDVVISWKKAYEMGIKEVKRAA